MAHFGLRLRCWQRDCSATNGGPPELDHSNKGTGSSIRVDALWLWLGMGDSISIVSKFCSERSIWYSGIILRPILGASIVFHRYIVYEARPARPTSMKNTSRRNSAFGRVLCQKAVPRSSLNGVWSLPVGVSLACCECWAEELCTNSVWRRSVLKWESNKTITAIHYGSPTKCGICRHYLAKILVPL